MKMLPKISVFLLLLGIITFVACEEENPTPITSNTNVSSSIDLKGVSEKKDRLAFDSKEDFTRIYKELSESTKSLKEFPSLFPNFESSLKACEKVTYEDYVNAGNSIEPFKDYITLLPKVGGELHVHPVVDNSAVASMVSKKGLFQVGEKIYKITFDYLYSTDVKTFEQNEGVEFTNLPNIQKEQVIHSFQSDDRDVWAKDCDIRITATSNQPRKLVGEVGQFITTFWASITARSWAYQRFSGIWWWKKVDTIAIDPGSITGTFQVLSWPFPTATFTGVFNGNVDTNDHFAESISVLQIVGNLPTTGENVVLINVTPNTTHRAIHGSSGTKTCRIIQ